MNSSLARHQLRDPADESKLRAMRAAVWHKQEIAVIPLADVPSDWDRQHVRNIAEKLYGRREPRRNGR